MGNSSKKHRKNNEKSLKRPDDSPNKNRAIANDENLININKIDWCNMELMVKCEICGERFDGRYPKQQTDCGHGSRHSFCGQCVAKLPFSESGYQCPMCYGS